MTVPPTATGIVSIHVTTWRWRDAPAAFAALLLDRRELQSVPGLRFARLLGTGSSTRPSVHLRRTAALLVWDGPAALAEFEATHPVPHRWRNASNDERYTLALIDGHGTWAGVDVLDNLEVVPPTVPIVVLTRATIPMRRWPRFWRMSYRVASEIERWDGCLSALAIGEAPVGRLGTLSWWRDHEALDRYVDEAVEHRDAMRRARAEGWFSEELFARFAVISSR